MTAHIPFSLRREHYEVLNKLKLSAGETLLVHAAAGGVGTFAVQLAVARGACVIGTASERNHEQFRSFGVDRVTYGKGLVDREGAFPPRDSKRSGTSSPSSRRDGCRCPSLSRSD
ncbi:hypothetical protein ACIQGO_32070 [Streptomyces shenzhenensis]|uniref:hypothetical protein n=1 Tax=Streptomyces shenzhenensis TaxID=943815 RepID=UPI0037FEBBDE